MSMRTFLLAFVGSLACFAGLPCPGQEQSSGETPANAEVETAVEVPAKTPTGADPSLQARWLEAIVTTNRRLAGETPVFSNNELGFYSATFQNPLGIEVVAVDPALRAQLGLAEGCGVVVTQVAPDSSVSQALQAFDIVLQLDDQAVGNPEAFQALTAERQGATVRFDVVRQAQPLELQVTLPNAPQYWIADQDYLLRVEPRLQVYDHVYLRQEQAQQYRIGVTLSEADDTLRSQLRLAAGEGLVVTDVVADSPATVAGIRPHDVLTMLDGRRLSTVEAINAQIQEIQERTVTAILFRGGEELSLEVTPRLSNVDEAAAGGLIHVYTTLGEPLQDFRAWTYIASDPLVNAPASGEPAAEAAASDAAAKLAELKQQVEALQATLQALDAALQAAPSDASSTTPPADSPASEETPSEAPPTP